MLHDLLQGDDPQINATVRLIDERNPDVLLLTDFDYDAGLVALSAFNDQLSEPYPVLFARRPNSGLSTGLDMNGDGYLGDPEDAQGFGWFSGDGGMALLSRWPVSGYRDLSDLLWKDVPEAELPTLADAPFPSGEARDIQRLSSTGHWIVDIQTDGEVFSVLGFAATPPVFDGPEDRNGLRNADEIRLWSLVLDGVYGATPERFIIAGNANLDPENGDGRREAIATVLSDPRLQDPLPQRPTANWPDGPGQLRVDYVLPDAAWQIVDAGLDSDSTAGPHSLVWVDILR